MREHRHVASREGRLLLCDSVQRHRWIGDDPRAVATRDLAVHLGAVLTWDEVFGSKFQFCPEILALTETTPPPSTADASGRYKAPIPGAWTEF